MNPGGTDRCGALMSGGVTCTRRPHGETTMHEYRGDTDRAPLMFPTRLLRCEWPPNPGVMPGDPQTDALLARITEDGGIREPLTIKLDWSVIDGAHRLSIARLLGIERVPVRVWTGVEFVE